MNHNTAFPDYDGEYDPSVCPPTRDTHDTQHTCAVRALCPAPQSWEDHCHVYTWFGELADGNTARLNDLIPYYQRRVDEILQRKFPHASMDGGDLKAIGMEALMLVLQKYDPSFGVPAQAYIRRQLPLRITDRLREEGVFSRAAADFDKRLNEVMLEHPGLTELQAAKYVVGTPDRHSTFTEQRVMDLMRERAMRSALHLDYVGAEGGEAFVDRVLIAGNDTVETVMRNEEARAAQKAISTLTEGLDKDDVDLLYAYVMGTGAVTVWAEEHGVERNAASARAQSLLSRLQGRTAELLNVSKQTLVSRQFDKNEAKMLEVLNTGRISPVTDALVPAEGLTSWDRLAVQHRTSTLPEKKMDDDPVLFE